MRDAGRGAGGGGLGGAGMRLPVPTGSGGLGIAGLIVVVLLYVLASCAGIAPSITDLGGSDGDSSTDRYAECESGADANRSQDCARLAAEISMTDYWEAELGSRFRPIEELVTFTDSVQTGCGGATSDVGPFYCPTDESIYLDTTFFDEVLERELGGPDGGFVELYVLAHEYGHHISNLLGYFERVRTQQGPQSDATRLELQADCYAGMWAHHAETTEGPDGEVVVEDITDEDVRLALEAASAVGDDHIQRKTQGQTNPETWNHGSSEMRMRWFTIGYEQGDLAACDTFAVPQV